MSAVVQLKFVTSMPIVKILGDLTLAPVKLVLLVMGNHALVRVSALSSYILTLVIWLLSSYLGRSCELSRML